MTKYTLRQNIISKLKTDQVAIAVVATTIGCSYRTIERYLANAANKSAFNHNSSHRKLTTPACLLAIKSALGTATQDELIEEAETQTA